MKGTRVRTFVAATAILCVAAVALWRVYPERAAADFPPPNDQNWVAIDCDLSRPGIQHICAIALGELWGIGVVVGNVVGDGSEGPWRPAAFNFHVMNSDKNVLLPQSPSCGGLALNCNPDFSQATMSGSGWDCSWVPPLADEDLDLNPATTQSRLVCFNPELDDPDIPQDGSTLFATVHFDAPAEGTTTLSLERVAVGNELSTLGSCNPSLLGEPVALCGTASVTVVDALAETDGDGCRDLRELGPDWLAGGQRSPTNPADFFDVPAPALLPDQTGGVRNKAITLQDALAILSYVGTTATSPSAPNSNGATFGSDWNENGIPDGEEYDRSPSTDPSMPWRSEAGNGAVTLQDGLVAMQQVGSNCN